MESIKSKGNTSILLDLVKRVCNEDYAEGSAQSMIVISPSEVPIVKETVIKNTCDWMSAETIIEVLEVESDCCNDGELTVLDLSRYLQLRELKVDDKCFENVKEVGLIGLNQLERVVIGKKCFYRKNDKDKSGRFHLKNCERLRELKIGCYSFSDYSVCEIENVPSLEVIEMGELNQWSHNFYYASLELKSDSERMR